MPKMNPNPSVPRRIIRRSDLTVNYEGGLAFTATPKTELVLRILTFLVGEPKFYGDTVTEIEEIQQLIEDVACEDPEFILKLAAYARNEMYLRSAPIFLLVEAVQYDNVKPFVRKYVPQIVRRADELTETIAYFVAKHGEIGKNGKASLPNCLKKGLADALHNFDEYQFAKYAREDKEVKLRDVIRLVHPVPFNQEESLLFKHIKERTLATPETWETEISGKGSTKEAWESIIPKMGYMAKLRNLRNFLKVGVDMTPVVKHLTNPTAVKNSKQFPFRFLSATKVLQGNESGNPFDRTKLIEALSVALELSVENIPKWKGRTFVSCDNSSSMRRTLSEKSSVQRIEVGAIMGALAQKISGCGVASVFGEGFAIVPVDPTGAITPNAFQIMNTNVGHSTYAYKALKYLIDKKIVVDRILIFSDEQCYNEGYTTPYGRDEDFVNNTLYAQLKLYKQKVNPNVYLYSFDLAGYGSLQFPENEPNVCLLGGFSDRIFEFIQKYEENTVTLVETITNYKIKESPKKEDMTDVKEGEQ